MVVIDGKVPTYLLYMITALDRVHTAITPVQARADRVGDATRCAAW
jgi:hypothetical protein